MAALSIAYTPTPLGAAEKLAIFASPQVSPGINFLPASRYKLLTVTAAAAASPANVLAAYEARFGAMISGQKIFFRLVVINSDGFASPVKQTSVIIA